jgi:hypothetical protein
MTSMTIYMQKSNQSDGGLIRKFRTTFLHKPSFRNPEEFNNIWTVVALLKITTNNRIKLEVVLT